LLQKLLPFPLFNFCFSFRLRQKHVENPDLTWSLPKDFDDVYADSENSEITV